MDQNKPASGTDEATPAPSRRYARICEVQTDLERADSMLLIVTIALQNLRGKTILCGSVIDAIDVAVDKVRSDIDDILNDLNEFDARAVMAQIRDLRAPAEVSK